MLMPCGCTLTAVAEAEMTVGEIVIPCACENDSASVAVEIALRQWGTVSGVG